MNQDMIAAARTVFQSIWSAGPSSDAMNKAVMEAMETENPEAAMRALLPELVTLTAHSTDIITRAFVDIDWSLEGNTAETFYGIFSGVNLPEELKGHYKQFEASRSITEKPFEEKYGKDPMSACLDKVGLLGEFTEMVERETQVANLRAALEVLPNVPVIQE